MTESIFDAARDIVSRLGEKPRRENIDILCQERWNYRVLSRDDALNILDETKSLGAWRELGPLTGNDHDEIIRQMAEACALADLRREVNLILSTKGTH